MRVLAEELLGPTSWQYVVIVFVSLIFGGHGLFISLVKNRKDTVQTLTAQVVSLSQQFGMLQGQISQLENQVKEVRREKHKYRAMANRYRLQLEAERAGKEKAFLELARLRESIKEARDLPST